MKNKSFFKSDKSAVIVLFLLLSLTAVSLADEKPSKGPVEEPILVNGDTVEYSADNRQITASGNVKVVYKGTTLTCKKMTVNTLTKDSLAEGDVRIEDSTGVILAREITYNFQDKKGVMLDATFRSPPYFGRAKKLERISETCFIASGGYATTCNLDRPHYRIASKKIKMYPKDKIQTTDDVFYLGQMPVAWLPRFNKSLKEPLYHVQLTPGKSGDWGPYMLSAWRYNITDFLKGRIYYDYRRKLGTSQGFGTNFNSEDYGKGDFKFYYTHEKPRDLNKEKIANYKDTPHEFQRYLIRLRQNWDIDANTNLTTEIHKIDDSKRQLDSLLVDGHYPYSQTNFLKTYFYREYEKDSQPLSYALLKHNFEYSNVNLLMQKRVNRWYTQLERAPEITYNLPDYPLGGSRLYLMNISTFSRLLNRNASPTELEEEAVRFDIYNQISHPFKLSIFAITPFVGIRETAFSQDKSGSSINPRTIHYSGSDFSTKFYRIFDVNSNFLGMEINKIRHIISPSARYSYIHPPTISPARLHSFDGIDSIYSENKVTLELINKLQTRRASRGNKNSIGTVDFATFKVNTECNMKHVNDVEMTHGFVDFLADLELVPYSWLRIESDAIYNRRTQFFKEANVDLSASLDKDTSFGIGHRYLRKGGKELTSQLSLRLSPKWKFRAYGRYQFASPLRKELKELEYTISRDLHCWDVDFTLNFEKERGDSFWVVFRLKAFPESEINFNQTYHTPKPRSAEGTTQ